MAKTRKAVTNVDKFARDKDVKAFMEKQREFEVVSDFARQHPEQQEKIMQLSRYQYQLEHTLASIQPAQDRPLNDICDENAITPWPELKLHSGNDGRFIKPAPSLCGLLGNYIYTSFRHESDTYNRAVVFCPASQATSS